MHDAYLFRMSLPPLALSVRQPWAWAIIYAGKDIENRSAGSIRAGRMDCRRICIHAASGMTRAEYEWAVDKMKKTATPVPRPEDLPRRAIIGTVDVIEIISASDSPWFGGKMGLRLANPEPHGPIPSPGALGYFEWQADGQIDPPKPWMLKWDAGGLPLFPDALPAFETPPKRPF